MKTALITAVAVGFGLAGDVFFKRSGDYLWVGFLLYAASGIPIWLAYRSGSWLEVGVWWQLGAVLLTLILGVTIFHEPITARKLLAFALALCAAWLINT